MNQGRFKNKQVVITGGGSGIGLATVKSFLSEGARVSVLDYQITDELVRTTCDVYQVDVRKSESIKEAVAEIIKKNHKIDVLINNAGIEFVSSLEEMEEEEWDRVLDTNLKGMFLTTRTVLPFLKESHGVIVNTASQLALVGSALFTAYTASKAAIVNFTRSLAIEGAKDGIRVNSVCPGAIHTPLLSRQFENGKKGPQGSIQDLIRMHPLGRLGEPEEIAKPILFLCSEDASFITGSALFIDGGYTSW
ncbi:SDR family NAD(P)-dependent oxidoreductase [Sporolactobacillus kofuensis]|uniref:SDR family NAD(P)-dependent oxidoreductase n=1 Tax=Sporolactobacillus kofuensis TaxID=269672 RepID=A0ABW1WG09_9BACL|nr:SDR family oxidoreductase [Sporolactobacillus kofuensis]MCO7175815.1 SDR family oxidoreductase [Sporolactobacillus kofuensis]